MDIALEQYMPNEFETECKQAEMVQIEKNKNLSCDGLGFLNELARKDDEIEHVSIAQNSLSTCGHKIDLNVSSATCQDIGNFHDNVTHFSRGDSPVFHDSNRSSMASSMGTSITTLESIYNEMSLSNRLNINSNNIKGHVIQKGNSGETKDTRIEGSKNPSLHEAADLHTHYQPSILLNCKIPNSTITFESSILDTSKQQNSPESRISQKFPYKISQLSVEDRIREATEDKLTIPFITHIPGYEIEERIGKGGFSVVHKGRHELTRFPVAIKIIDKNLLRDAKERDRVEKEIRAMKHLGGQCSVVQLYDVVETNEYIHLIMEYFEGGTLLDLVQNQGRLCESHAAILFRQLLQGLEYCHQKRLVHRDIKLENLLLKDSHSLYLADFGLCTYFLNSDSKLKCYCGSPSYAAPEIVKRAEYCATPVDVWSAGVVLYGMLCGYLPFHSQNKYMLRRLICSGKWSQLPGDISLEAEHLIRGMLNPDPGTRFTVQQALSHPWLMKNCPPQIDQILAFSQNINTNQVIDYEIACAWSRLAKYDVDKVIRSISNRICSPITAGYHLMYKSKKTKEEDFLG